MLSPQQSQFFDACRRGDRAEAESLLAQDAELLNVQDAKGFTPLIIAVYNNEIGIARFLLSKNADLAAQDAAGNTALMGVCFKGYKELAEILLAAGAEVNQRNYQGATALTYAATFGHLEIAELLLEKGAYILVPDVRGKSPIDHAVLQENEAMVLLLEKYLRRNNR
jgi:ankyrin repeat protein